MYVCVCARKEQSRLKMTVFSSSTHSLGIGGFFLSLFVNFNKRSLFIQHSYQSIFFFHLLIFLHCPSLLSILFVPRSSLILFLSRSPTFFFFCSLIYSASLLLLLHLLFPQEPQTTVIHNPSDGAKVHIVPRCSPFVYPLCHSLLPRGLLLHDPSISNSMFVSASKQWFTEVCACVFPHIKVLRTSLPPG